MTMDRHVARATLPAMGLALLIAVAPTGSAHAGSTKSALASAVSAAPQAVPGLLARRSLRLLDGRDASLSPERGEVVVVNFWATWCRPCLRELPALGRLHEEIAPRGGRVLAVAIDSDRRRVESFITAHEIAVPVAHDGPTGLVRQLDLKAVPLTLVLDRTGAVAWATTRSDEVGIAETRAAVLRLLAAPPATPPIAGDDDGGTR